MNRIIQSPQLCLRGLEVGTEIDEANRLFSGREIRSNGSHNSNEVAHGHAVKSRGRAHQKNRHTWKATNTFVQQRMYFTLLHMRWTIPQVVRTRHQNNGTNPSPIQVQMFLGISNSMPTML